MAPRPAPADLQRRIADIPRDHPRRRGAPSWRRWLDAFSMPWTASLAGAVASLAVGFWLGFSGLVETSDAYADSDEELVSLVFPSVPTTMGDAQ